MNDDLFDDELCGMVKFTDATTTAQKHVETAKKPARKERVEEKKTAQKSASNPEEAEYETVKTQHDLKVINFAKWPLLFVCLEYLLFYWQQTGQMQQSAAMPSMLACALLAGISVGKNWKWRK